MRFEELLLICAEIPNPEIDPDLHDVIITNMIHGPCGTINSQSPCMVDGKCSKRYPRNLTAETITGNDGYPMYRRRSPDDNGRTITTKVKGNDFLIDNIWIVPYSPLLSKTFKAHCNVEYCNSVKSIKYICKYVTKGSDMAVFGVQTADTNNEITHYQVGRYVSCNETIIYSHSPFMNVIPLLYIWRCIWRMVNEFISTHQMLLNVLKRLQRQH
jgi:hypothetical protein